MARLSWLLFVLCVPTGLMAGSYQIVYQERIEGAEHFRDIDPILGHSGQLEGFVFCDTVQNSVHIHRFGQPEWISIDSIEAPRMTINCWFADTLSIYYLARNWLLEPKLGRINLCTDTISRSAISPAFFGHEESGMYYNLSSVLSERIAFGRGAGSLTTIHFEQNLLGDGYEITFGPMRQWFSTSAVYDPQLNTLLRRYRATSLRTGNLTPNSGTEFAWYENYHYWWNFQDSANDPNYGQYTFSTLGCSDTTRATILSLQSNGGFGKALFVDDFRAGDGYDEAVYYGNSEGLTAAHPNRAWHAASYSFAAGQPEEIWYAPLSGVELDFVHHARQYIAGRRGSTKMIALSYLTGRLVDSVYLGRSLEAMRHFETAGNPTDLNLVGRSHDTVFVYQFNTATAADEEPGHLPTEFRLQQNYPNPFNSGTMIRFSNPRRQQVMLKVFNILGQEVVTLHEAETLAGDRSLFWNGLDSQGRPVSSGIYLARLSSPVENAVIKMVLLK